MIGQPKVAVVKGGGDIGTAVAIRLKQAGLLVVVTELPRPLVVRREVALASAVFAGKIIIEGETTSRKVEGFDGLQPAWDAGEIPVLVDPHTQIITQLHPFVLIDAIIAKNNTGTSIHDAPIVIALGPGFQAGVDCHAVIETQRCPNLGRPLFSGSTEPDTGIPGLIGGETYRRVLRSPVEGTFVGHAAIGDFVHAGQIVAEVSGQPISSEINGVVRGLLADGLYIHSNEKIGDIDPRGIRELCLRVSDKAWKVADGVLDAIHNLEVKLQ
jgi:xanthine dehydrogenase accessory factor